MVQAAATFLSSLTAQLRAQLAAAQADVATASRHGLVHGTLLCLKYTVEALPWTTLASSSATISMPTSAAAAAACGLSGHVSVSSDGQQGEVVVVCGPVPCVLHCWVTDLAALLTAVADLVKPWLSAQVRFATWAGSMALGGMHGLVPPEGIRLCCTPSQHHCSRVCSGDNRCLKWHAVRLHVVVHV